jgi:hypothetical protein
MNPNLWRGVQTDRWYPRDTNIDLSWLGAGARLRPQQMDLSRWRARG